MNPYSIPPLIGAIMVIILGLFVFNKNKRSMLNSTFALFAFSIFVWLFTYSIAYLTNNKNVAIPLFKIGYTAVIFIPVTWYHFVITFLGKKKEEKVVYLIYTIGIIFVLFLWWTNYFMIDTCEYFWGYYPKVGFLHPFYLLFVLLLFVRYITLLYFGYSKKDEKKLSPIEYQRIRYIFWATIIGNLVVVDFIPNYKIELYPFGFIFMVSFVSIVSYAIVRYQLMEIEVIIKKTLVFAGLSAFVVGTFVLVTFLIQDILGNIIGIPRIWTYIISAMIIAASIGPIRNFLINATDKYLFQKKYDPVELIRTFSKGVLTVLDLDKIAKSIVDRLVNALNLTSCALLIPDREGNKFIIKESYGIQDKNISYAKDAHMISYLNKVNSMILKDGEKPLPDRVIKDMELISASTCLAIMIRKQLIGVLCLGKKKSDQEYTKEDVDMLLLLADALGVAITNALAFEDVRQKEKLAAIGMLAAGIKHDIGTPLNQMSSAVQGFLIAREEGDHQKMDINEVLSDAYDLLTRCQMTFSKVSKISAKFADFASPKRKAVLEPINVSESIEDALGTLDHEIQARNISVKKDIQKDIPPIVADREYMQEIFFNIIRNAAQAIEEAHRSKDESIITITAKQTPEKNILVEIKDTGVGIPEDGLDKVFEPYYTTRAEGRGTGLGLAIVKELVGRNNGKISIKSELGKGTSFILEFPGVNP